MASSVSAEKRLTGNERITVCDKCLCACCWQGEFYCEDARTAGTTTISVSQARNLKREAEHYWLRDLGLAS